MASHTPPSSPPASSTATAAGPAPNLFLSAPPLAPSTSTTTTASATTTASSQHARGGNGGGADHDHDHDDGSAAGSGGNDDKRLNNMPKALATACVRAFIAWGHDHKGNPSAYQAFLRQQLPRFPGVEGEKVRLYMKNVAAAYQERYLPARARASLCCCVLGGYRVCM